MAIDVGIPLVHARERADTVLGQKLGLVQHSPEQTLHAMPSQQGQQPAMTAPLLIPVRNKGCQVRPIPEEPFQAALEVGYLVEQLRLESLDGEQRNEADHRADLQRLRTTVG